MGFFQIIAFFVLCLRPVLADYSDYANTAITTLQERFYSIDTGLWYTYCVNPPIASDICRDDLWWQSGNIIEMIARFGLHDDSFKQNAIDIISNTHAKSGSQAGADNWINTYYDDMGWWAMGWITSYDLTGDTKFLSTAISLFEDMTGGWSTPCNGGLWWSKDRNYTAAISNELFLSVAAHLANRVSSSEKEHYTNWSQMEWDWFRNSGLINSDGLVNDGLDTDCENNEKTTYTYNQGVVLAGLSELSRANGDGSLLKHADAIAQAVMAKLTDRGILTEPGDGPLDEQGALFKGAFVRGLSTLYQHTRKQEYGDFLKKNADAAWAQPKAEGGLIVDRWQGGSSSANTGSHVAGIDVLVAAALTS